MAEGYIPLRVTLADASGKPLVSSRVADTSPGATGSKFEVPVGYRKADPSALRGAVKR